MLRGPLLWAEGTWVQVVSLSDRVWTQCATRVVGSVIVTGRAKVWPSGPNTTPGPALTTPRGNSVAGAPSANMVIVTGLLRAPGGITILAPRAGPAVNSKLP